MPLQPSGEVVRDRRGLSLLLERTVRLPADEAWEWLTTAARLKRWIGIWKGTPEVGAQLQFTMTAEEGSPTEPLTITRCEPGSRLGIVWGGHRISVAIAQVGQSTTVYLSQEIADWREAGSWGPGWEWYLDRMLAAQSGASIPGFEQYLSVQRPYYERIALQVEPIGPQTDTGR